MSCDSAIVLYIIHGSFSEDTSDGWMSDLISCSEQPVRIYLYFYLFRSVREKSEWRESTGLQRSRWAYLANMQHRLHL